MSGMIPPYGEREQAAAVEVIRLWRDQPVRTRVGDGELSLLVREVAGALVTARREGWAEALDARNTAYADDRCGCTACVLEHLEAQS